MELKSDARGLRAMDDQGSAYVARWVRVGIGLALAGYAAVTLGDVAIYGAGQRPWAILTQALTVLACGVALVLALRGRIRLGAGITLAAVWLELHSGLPNVGFELSALIAFPVLVSAGGILLGGRAAYLLAGVTSVTLPAGAALSASRGGPGVDADGWYLWLIVSVSMFVSAALVRLGLDSFGRVLAAARSSERRLADVLENAPDGVLATDLQGRIVSANPAAERIMARPRAELVGRPLKEALEGACVDDEGIARIRGLLGQAARAERSVFFRSGDGHRSVDLVVAPITWDDGSVGRQVTLRDLTELRRAWDSERILRVQLEHAQRLEAVGRIAGGVAHEFNNLLTVVGGAAELLLQEHGGEGDELARDILDAKTRGASLTRQLLAFARKEMARPVRLPLGRVFDEIEPLLRSIVTEKVALTPRIAPEVPPVVADQGQVEQVIMNLVLNARDAIEGAGRIEVGLAGPGTRQRWGGDEGWVVPDGMVEFWVEDTGSGMDADVLARAFEPFFTTKPRGEGTGLGLATVHGIVTQNGGSIRVRSEPGVGTRVSVRWPVAEEAVVGA